MSQEEDEEAVDASPLISSSDTPADERGTSLSEAAAAESKRESRRWHFVSLGILVSAGVLVLVVGLSVGLSSLDSSRRKGPLARAESLLAEYPVIDG